MPLPSHNHTPGARGAALAFMALLPALVAALLLLFAEASVAQETVQKEPGELKTANQENCREAYPGEWLAVIVPCIRAEVEIVTQKMTNEFALFLQGPAYAFLTLVITLFGVKVLMNEGDPKKDSFLLLVKIGIALAFLNNFGGMIPAAFAIVQEGVEITSTTLSTGTLQCDKMPGELPWAYVDCVVGELMGFAPGLVVGSSALGAVGSLLWSGQFGSILFLSALAGFFFLLKLIIRATYTYLMAIVVLGFTIVISPLILPLMWMDATKQYFDRWLGILVAMLIMPAIVMGYLTLSFSVMDQVLFNEDIGVATLLAPEEVAEMRGARISANSGTLLTDSRRANEAMGEDFSQEDMEQPDESNPIVPFLSGSSDSNPLNRLYTMDLGAGEAGVAGQIFFAFVALAVIGWLLDAMLSQLIQLAQIMLGGGYFMHGAVSDNPFEGSLNQVHGQVSQGLNQTSSPGGFLSQLGSNLARAPGAFINGLTRDPNSRS